MLLHGGNPIAGWTAKHTHPAVLTTFQLSANAYGLNQLRYDLRKLKGHGLLKRDGSRYAYQLTAKGVQITLLFLFFHKRLCGPLFPSSARSRAPAQQQAGNGVSQSRAAIQNIVDLLAAA